MDGGSAGFVGSGIVDVCVAGGSDSYGDIFHTVRRQDVGEGGDEQSVAGLGGYGGEGGFEGGEDEIGIVVAGDHGVGGEPVRARSDAGYDAGGVDAGYGREYGVVSAEEYPFAGEAGEVGGKVVSDLRGLESVEGGDEDVGHGDIVSFSLALAIGADNSHSGGFHDNDWALLQ